MIFGVYLLIRKCAVLRFRHRTRLWRTGPPAGETCLAAAAARIGLLAHSTALRAGQLVDIIPYFGKKAIEIGFKSPRLDTHCYLLVLPEDEE
jgi:hypothetical protein